MSRAFDRSDSFARAPDDPDWEWKVIELRETTDGLTPAARSQGEWAPRTDDPVRYAELMAEANGPGGA
jgi:hypothetical protein